MPSKKICPSTLVAVAATVLGPDNEFTHFDAAFILALYSEQRSHHAGLPDSIPNSVAR